jgi:hypothetical protein
MICKGQGGSLELSEATQAEQCNRPSGWHWSSPFGGLSIVGRSSTAPFGELSYGWPDEFVGDSIGR